MRIGRLAIMMAIALGGVAAGPLSKFEKSAPDLAYRTTAKSGDVERCLIDVDGQLAPQVYRQPDQPDRVTLIWMRPNRIAQARVDLQVVAGGTEVKAWSFDPVIGCAPKA